jgi:hypothetical protein
MEPRERRKSTVESRYKATDKEDVTVDISAHV